MTVMLKFSSEESGVGVRLEKFLYLIKEFFKPDPDSHSCIMVMLLSSCLIVKRSNGNDAAANAPEVSDTEADNIDGQSTAEVEEAAEALDQTAPEETAPTETAPTETAPEAEEPVNSDITLESVKQAAIDAGYAAEDIQKLRVMTEPIPLRGIYVNYADDSMQSQTPVYEFSSPGDAQMFALQVNQDGYSLCAVNGKLVTLAESRYGVILNDKQKTVLETLLKSSFMAYEEPAPSPVSSNKDYAGDCTRIRAISTEINKLLNKSVLIYAKSLPDDDPGKYLMQISFSMLSSPDMSYTSELCEDQTKMDQVAQLWESYGCTDVELKHNAANDYTLSGKRAGMDETFSIHCMYSPERDSLRILDIDGGRNVEMFEFVPLGQDRYAFQTLYDRGIIGYKDGKVNSLIYSANERSDESAYDPDRDSIYPEGKGVDDTWVSKANKGTFEQFITFDGTKLSISAKDFTGTELKANIDVK